MRKIFVLILILLTSFVFADSFTSEFYKLVNEYREDMGVQKLEVMYKAEKVAESYSEVLADNGEIDHKALTEFEFERLCLNYGISSAIMREILISYPYGRTPLQVFMYFYGSESHRLAIEAPDGEFIGAGYVTKNNMSYFTAYIINFKENL